MRQIFISTSSLLEMVALETDSIGVMMDIVKLIRGLGADGVEVREEQFRQMPTLGEFADMRAQCLQAGLEIHYSSPQPIWFSDGTLNGALEEILQRAKALGATLVKVSLGDIAIDAMVEERICELGEWVRPFEDIRVTVENDQTLGGGRTAPLVSFLEECKESDVPVGMTFDLGNWTWTGEDALVAAQAFTHYVDYVHVKVADERTIPLVAVAPEFTVNDQPRLRKALSMLPKDLPYCIEYSLVGYEDDEIRRQIAQLRQFTE